MKDFFRNRTALILFFVALVVLTLAISTAMFKGEANPLSDTIRVVLTPIRAVTNGVSNLFSSAYSYIYEVEELRSENREYRIRIAEMEHDIRESKQALEENERLRELLGLSERRRDLTFVMAEIVSRDTSNWASTFTIGKGSAHGIEPFDCVINEEGFFAGYVSEVGTNWSIVTTIIDSDVELGAIIYRTREPAVAEGDFSLMSEGLLKLTYLPEDTVLLNGDIILTSGVGGVYPKDLVIGTVTEVKKDISGMGDYAIIEPRVDLNRLTQVFIITDFDISE
ncbi:MAG: rod shape-determining protein MreC [Clostridiales bacterium]|nr:rod shape-determining protein MreC [Clostridiales bacterium]